LPAVSPARNASRHAESRAAVAPRARERGSRSSPRKRRRAASALRRAEKPARLADASVYRPSLDDFDRLGHGFLTAPGPRQT